MANFVSTTTPAYSDPIKALSIKALEQRLKDQQAQSAAQQDNAAMMATIPGGIGHVLGVVGDKMEQGRIEQAAATRRAELANVMAGVDWNAGPTAEQVAKMHSADPELAKQALTTMAENRRAAAQNDTQRYGYDSTAKSSAATTAATVANSQLRADVDREGYGNQAAIETAKLEAAERAAAEKARVDKEAATEQQKVLREGQDPEFVKMSRALTDGKIDQATFDAWKKRQLAPPASEQKFTAEQQKESVDNQSALTSLDQAVGFLDHPDGIFSGKNADLKTAASGRLPEKLTGLSEKTRENTSSYNKIMGGQALQLLTQMKGASSDRDVKINFDIANDPNATIDEKKRAIGILREKLSYYVKINNAAIAGAGGEVPKLGGGGPASATADPLEGKTASGPNGPIIRRGGKWVPNG